MTEAGLSGFDDYAEAQLGAWSVPGAAVAVIRDGRLVHARGYGLRDVARRLPVTADTVFAIGSCTKSFAATTVGIAVDEGKLDWDTPVRRYLPSFQLWDLMASERMTPRDLLSHRSGLPGHDFFWYNASLTSAELVDRLRYLEPVADFRSRYGYQNLMVMTAGYLAGQVAGTTWADYARRRILGPLGMTNTHVSVHLAQEAPDVSQPYHEKTGGVARIPFRDIDNIGGAGCIYSTASDMARWIRMNLDKGGAGTGRIISERSLQEIHTPQTAIPDRPRYAELLWSSYCMGWIAHPYRGKLVLRHGGRTDGFSAMTTFLPHEGMGVVVLSNVDMVGTPLCYTLTWAAIDRLLGLDPLPWDRRLRLDYDAARRSETDERARHLSGRRPGTRPAHPLEDYEGDYTHPGYGHFRVRAVSNGLEATYNNIVFPLTHWHYEIFEMYWEISDAAPDVRMSVTFHTDLAGVVSSVSVPMEIDVSAIVFRRVPPSSTSR